MGSCCAGALISIVVTLIKPDNEFDWSETKKINPRGRAMDVERMKAAQSSPKDVDGPSADGSIHEKDSEKADALTRTSSIKEPETPIDDAEVEDYETLRKSLKVATWLSVSMSFIIIFVRDDRRLSSRLLMFVPQIIPIPMFLSHYVFSLTFFKAWVIICVIWLFIAACITSILPLWESRGAMADIGRGVIRDAFGGGLRRKRAPPVVA